MKHINIINKQRRDDQMNIKTLKKINEGRRMFPQLNVKKNGTNKFQHFKYYQLDDLLSADNAICERLELFTKLNQLNETNICMEVWDLNQDDDQEPVLFYIPSCAVNNGNITQGQQEHGSIQKYAWRYLLLQLWNISEADSIDASDISLSTKIEVDEDRIDELTKEIGNSVYEKGGDTRNKSQLLAELNKQFKKKTITSQEYEAIKKVINDMK